MGAHAQLDAAHLSSHATSLSYRTVRGALPSRKTAAPAATFQERFDWRGRISIARTASKGGSRGSPRRLFTSDDDALLVELVGQLGANARPLVADRLPGRSPCQCKERDCTSLRQTVLTSPWSDAEDSRSSRKCASTGRAGRTSRDSSRGGRRTRSRTDGICISAAAASARPRWTAAPDPTRSSAIRISIARPGPVAIAAPPQTAQAPGEAAVIKAPQHPRKEQFPSVFSLPFPQNQKNE
jgi:hypothetical protein